MIVAIDFDGTIVEHVFPEIGAPVPGALDWMKKFQKAGAQLILWTMRSDYQEAGNVLSEAVAYCAKNGIVFYGVNENPDQTWSDSPKAYAHTYIDDAAAGVPLIYPDEGRPYVDWDVVGPEVMKLLT